MYSLNQNKNDGWQQVDYYVLCYYVNIANVVQQNAATIISAPTLVKSTIPCIKKYLTLLG